MSYRFISYHMIWHYLSIYLFPTIHEIHSSEITDYHKINVYHEFSLYFSSEITDYYKTNVYHEFSLYFKPSSRAHYIYDMITSLIIVSSVKAKKQKKNHYHNRTVFELFSLCTRLFLLIFRCWESENQWIY